MKNLNKLYYDAVKMVDTISPLKEKEAVIIEEITDRYEDLFDQALAHVDVAVSNGMKYKSIRKPVRKPSYRFQEARPLTIDAPPVNNHIIIRMGEARKLQYVAFICPEQPSFEHLSFDDKGPSLCPTCRTSNPLHSIFGITEGEDTF